MLISTCLEQPTDETEEPSEGFWREFFLLSPDPGQLHALLDGLSPDETLGLQVGALLRPDYWTRAQR